MVKIDKKTESRINMKKKLFFILILLALSGCKEKKAEEQEKTEPLVIEETSKNTIVTDEVSYLVSLKDSILSLSKIDEADEENVTSIEIDTKKYPVEDIEKLKNGIETSSLEEGYEILENFTN